MTEQISYNNKDKEKKEFNYENAQKCKSIIYKSN